MNEETGFLNTIRQTPRDETARLVYADWLDEQTDELSKAKANFIRLEARMAAAPEVGLNQARLLNRLRKWAALVPPEWLAIVSHPVLEECRFTFEFECPKEWQLLAPTDIANIRFCDACQRTVHFCETLDEGRDHVRQGDCVAVSQALVRQPNDLRTQVYLTLGIVTSVDGPWDEMEHIRDEQDGRDPPPASESGGKKNTKRSRRRGKRG